MNFEMNLVFSVLVVLTGSSQTRGKVSSLCLCGVNRLLTCAGFIINSAHDAIDSLMESSCRAAFSWLH